MLLCRQQTQLNVDAVAGRAAGLHLQQLQWQKGKRTRRVCLQHQQQLRCSRTQQTLLLDLPLPHLVLLFLLLRMLLLL